MCGIGGLIKDGAFTIDEAKICRDLFAALDRRGGDAWGYYDGEDIVKDQGDFSDSDEFLTLPEELAGESNVFLCHTRYATQGDPNKNKNNHPFELGPFVFAHNGVIFWTEDFKNEWTIATDSFWILYWIWREYGEHNKNILRAVDDGLDHVQGQYACWLYNKDDGFPYVWSNRNPHIALEYSVEDEFTIFASTRDIIASALGNPTRSQWLRQTLETKRIRPNTLYRIHYDDVEPIGKVRGTVPTPRQYQKFLETFAPKIRTIPRTRDEIL